MAFLSLHRPQSVSYRTVSDRASCATTIHASPGTCKGDTFSTPPAPGVARPASGAAPQEHPPSVCWAVVDAADGAGVFAPPGMPPGAVRCSAKARPERRPSAPAPCWSTPSVSAARRCTMAPYMVVRSALDGPWCRGSVLPHHGRHTWQASPMVATMGFLGGIYNQGGGSRRLGVRAPKGRTAPVCAPG